jgi:hypothetical protein
MVVLAVVHLALLDLKKRIVATLPMLHGISNMLQNMKSIMDRGCPSLLQQK